MEKYATVSTAFDAKSIHEKLTLLKARYERVSQSLTDKNAPRKLQSIRRLEREFLFLDIKRLEKMLAPTHTPKESVFRSFFHIRRHA